MKHDAHGWWLAEAGPVAPAAPLRGDRRADVVVIGGGYAGLWTAWQLLERGASVAVLEADVCGHGPSGRNGGFCETLWSNLPDLVERFGAERALAAARASSESVAAIGAWCEAEGVDAWFRRKGFLFASTSAAQDAAVEEIAGHRRRARGRRRPRSSRSTATRCAPAAPRRCSAAACSSPTTRPCTRRGWRSACASA